VRTTTNEVGDTTTFTVTDAVIFSNYLNLKGKVLATKTSTVVLDLTATSFVDHTVMERLDDLTGELKANGRALVVTGLGSHVAVSGQRLPAPRASTPAPAPNAPVR